MIHGKLLPRLSPERARALKGRIMDSPVELDFDPSSVDEVLSSGASFPSTGGAPSTAGELLRLRAQVVETLDASGVKAGADFDLVVGRALFDASVGRRSEFGDFQVWDFITLVLLPDLAWRRISLFRSQVTTQSFKERLSAGNRRHVFRRIWLRYALFGVDFVESAELKEDLYAALFERTVFAEKAALSRVVAQKLISSGMAQDSDRTPYREFVKRLRAASGFVALSVDDEASLERVVEHVYQATLRSLEVGASASSESPAVKAPAEPDSEPEQQATPPKPIARRRPLSLRRLLGGA